jgi:DUF1365 family protein
VRKAEDERLLASDPDRTTRYDPENGQVVHKFRHSLTYDYINVDSNFRAWWGGLYREDHFGDPQVPLTEAVRELVRRETGVYPSGPVDLVTHLREWGYCFNPIALFLCWDTEARGAVRFVVPEVSNTPWGERTVQVLDLSTARKGAEDGTLVIEKPKTLHVSPFNPMPDSQATWVSSEERGVTMNTSLILHLFPPAIHTQAAHGQTREAQGGRRAL